MKRREAKVQHKHDEKLKKARLHDSREEAKQQAAAEDSWDEPKDHNLQSARVAYREKRSRAQAAANMKPSDELDQDFLSFD